MSDDIRRIVARVLGLPMEQVSDDAGPDVLPGWDSVAHLDIVLSVEAERGVHFQPETFATLTSVRALDEAARDLARRRAGAQ